MIKKFQIGIIGSAGVEEYPKGGKPKQGIYKTAYALGKLIAENKAILVTGGKGGIMEEAARGAKDMNGITVGVVKGAERFTSNQYTDIEVVTGMVGSGGESTMVLMCDGLIGIGGGAGTLQELTIAYYNNIPTVLIDTEEGWAKILAGKYLDKRKKIKFKRANSPQKAVKILFKELKKI